MFIKLIYILLNKKNQRNFHQIITSICIPLMLFKLIFIFFVFKIIKIGFFFVVRSFIKVCFCCLLGFCVFLVCNWLRSFFFVGFRFSFSYFIFLFISFWFGVFSRLCVRNWFYFYFLICHWLGLNFFI